MDLAAVTPQWIAELYKPKTGRDHLGLGSVSANQILASLSPGVQVLTFHPRYHSFYAFLLDEFWRRDLPRSDAAYQAFYRPREFIFSLGANMCKLPEHGRDMRNIVGGQKTAGWAKQSLTHYSTSKYGAQYIKSPLGGYGLYYRTVMAQLGLVYPGGRGLPYPIDVPSETGKVIAEAFRQAIKDTAYYQHYFDQDEADVPREVIQEYIERACLCQLQVSAAPDRIPLLHTFLHGGGDLDSLARRRSFRLLLDIAEQTYGHKIDQDQYRQLLYFRESDGGATYTPREGLLSTYRRWRLYQAREYYSFALNTMWYHLCDWGIQSSGDIRPLSLNILWEHIASGLDFGLLAEHLRVTVPKFHASSDIREMLHWLEVSSQIDSPSLDEAYNAKALLHEHKLYNSAIGYPEASHIMIAGMLSMLGMIFIRFSDPEIHLEEEWQVSKMGIDGRLSIHGFIQSMIRKLEGGRYSVEEFARWIFTDYIILQHQLVATSKLPENTFHFRRDGNRLRFISVYDARSFWDSRFPALSTTIHELGLCDDLESPNHYLSDDGHRLLEKGDL